MTPAPTSGRHRGSGDILAETARRLREDLAVPGLSLAARFADGTEAAAAAGHADVERGFAMLPSHRLSGGSTSKTFVAALAHKAAGAGRLSFDQPLSAYFRDNPWLARLANADRVTVGMLINHSAGFADLPWLALYDHPAFHDVFVARTDYAEVLDELGCFDRPAAHEPGQRQAYSDVNYVALGWVLEQVFGEKLELAIHRALVYPLQMNSTEAAVSSAIAGLARTYPNPRGGVQSEAPFLARAGNNPDGVVQVSLYHAWAGGCYVTTPADLARWAWHFLGGRLFGGDYLAALTARPAVPDPSPGDAEALDGEEICHGCYRRMSPTLGPRLYHDGTEIGTKSWMVYLPEHGLAVALQANRILPRQITSDAVDAVAAALLER